MYFYTWSIYTHIINPMPPFELRLNGVVSFFSDAQRHDAVLIGTEITAAASYHPKRMSDFANGRYCARETLSRLGFEPTEIPKGIHREPVWPAGITGSISHTTGLTGAIAARKSDQLSLGLDIELRGSVTKELWQQLFTKSEQDILASHELESPDLPTVFFSIKESFYKMQFPLTGRFLDFPEVEIVPSDHEYKLRLTGGRQLPGLPGHYFTGHGILGAHVITWCALPAI